MSLKVLSVAFKLHIELKSLANNFIISECTGHFWETHLKIVFVGVFLYPCKINNGAKYCIGQSNFHRSSGASRMWAESLCCNYVSLHTRLIHNYATFRLTDFGSVKGNPQIFQDRTESTVKQHNNIHTTINT